MIERTVGIDLAVRGEHVARIFNDGRPVGKPIRFRLTSAALERYVFLGVQGLQPARIRAAPARAHERGGGHLHRS